MDTTNPTPHVLPPPPTATPAPTPAPMASQAPPTYVPIGVIPPPDPTDMLQTIIVLFARGYTVRAVHRKLTALVSPPGLPLRPPTPPTGDVDTYMGTSTLTAADNEGESPGPVPSLPPPPAPRLPRPTVQVPDIKTLLRIAIDYGQQIEDMRKEIARRVINVGLARREERMLRLTELVEELEPSIGESPRAAMIYVKALEQLRRESEALGIRSEVPEDDVWHSLLTKLSRQNATSQVVTRE